MAQVRPLDDRKLSPGASFISWLGRVLISVVIPIIAFIVIYYGFIFLRDSKAPRWVIASVAIVWGVGGVAMLYYIFNGIVERLPTEWSQRLQPYVFVGPAMAILLWYLTIPVFRTFWLSLFGRDGPPAEAGFFEALGSDAFVGLQNYVSLFTERLLQEALRNNLMWIVFGSTFSVGLGLLVAMLADRSKFERVSKSLVFLPMAISFVGASVIWDFVYEVRPVDQAQIGLLNAITAALGGTPHPWEKWVDIAPWNNLFLILIVIWLQTGYSMVLFSAALKGIPEEIIEAGRIDGGSEIQYILPHHDPLHHGHYHHCLDHDRNFHLEDIRCGLGDDRWAVRYACDRHPVLQAVLHSAQFRSWVCDCHHLANHGHSSDDLQFTAVPGTGGLLK